MPWKNKKIVVLFFLILAIAIGVFFIIRNIEQKKTDEKARQERHDACIKSFDSVSLEELAGLSSRSFEAQGLFGEYLGCRFSWFASLEVSEKYSRLVGVAGYSEPAKQDFAGRLKDAYDRMSSNFADASKNLLPLSYLFIPDFSPEEICPASKMDEDLFAVWQDWLTEKDYPQEISKSSADKLCETIWRYTGDPSLFEGEVANFSDWPADSLLRRIDYRRDDILAVRFLDQGTGVAPAFCQSLPLAGEKTDCQEFWSQLKDLKEANILKTERIRASVGSFSSCRDVLDQIKEAACRE